MGSDENHFMVSLIVRDKVTVFAERRAEAELNQGPSCQLKTKEKGQNQVQLEGAIDPGV